MPCVPELLCVSRESSTALRRERVGLLLLCVQTTPVVLVFFSPPDPEVVGLLQFEFSRVFRKVHLIGMS